MKNNILTERYKFILDKIKLLDEQYIKNTNLTYKIIISLVSFISLSKLAFLEGKIDFTTFTFCIKSAGFILCLSFLYLSFVSIAIILSWIDYRKDEYHIFKKLELSDYRKKPKLNGMYRWSETYFIIICILLSILGLVLFLAPSIVP